LSCLCEQSGALPDCEAISLYSLAEIAAKKKPAAMTFYLIQQKINPLCNHPEIASHPHPNAGLVVIISRVFIKEVQEQSWL
jgi:hypothetical protein